MFKGAHFTQSMDNKIPTYILVQVRFRLQALFFSYFIQRRQSSSYKFQFKVLKAFSIYKP